MQDKTILHCDLNAFYASVELLSRPELLGLPVAVCGDPDSRHGIILAKNEPAKEKGVKTAETIWQAKKKCPDLILLPPHHELYSKYSKLVNQIYLRFTDQVEPFGIDESWLDVTGSLHLFGGGEKIAYQIKELIKEELGLTISVGVSFCKVFSKLGSDLKKPDAVTVLTRQNYLEKIAHLPVTSLLMVGRKTEETLKILGAKNIGELFKLDKPLLSNALGKHGLILYSYVHGEDQDPVKKFSEQDEVKSIGSGMTFSKDLVTSGDMKAGLSHLSQEVSIRLRKKNLFCRTVKLTIKTPDFKSIDRQTTLPSPTNVTRDIYDCVLSLLLKEWSPSNPVRLFTITVSGFTSSEDEEITLFEPDKKHEKLKNLDHSIDEITKKHGKAKIFPASSLKTDLFDH